MITSQTTTIPNFDWQQLRQLAGEDTDFEYELLEIFLQDTQQSLQALEQAISSRSTQAIQDIAHSLRGASANVGANSLAIAARRLEQVPHCDQLTEAANLLQQLHDYCGYIQSHLQTKQ
ncbi:MAG: Hpt domain-containing protein [Phormidesmis sp.]